VKQLWRPLAAIGLITVAACGSGKPKEVPQVTFAYPSDTVLTRYVNVPGAAWLGDGRWVVVAGEFNEAAIVDFGSKAARPSAGRERPNCGIRMPSSRRATPRTWPTGPSVG
jgi:hypothetical protein